MNKLIREIEEVKDNPKRIQGGIIKNSYPLNIDKPRGYQLNSADNRKTLERRTELYASETMK